MNIASKRGVTLASLVAYLVLFTVFTAFVSGVSSSINDKLFENRGTAINYSNLNKLQHNLEISAMESSDVTVNGIDITFSNGDIYKFDYTTKRILKNGGTICENVQKFDVDIANKLSSKIINVNVQFYKYVATLNRNIVVLVEE